jgi:hypothetical protein
MNENKISDISPLEKIKSENLKFLFLGILFNLYRLKLNPRYKCTK